MKENFNLNDNTAQTTTGGLKKIKDYLNNELPICNSPSHNPHQEIMSEIQKSASKKTYMDVDFDNVEINDVKEKLNGLINDDSLTFLKTRGGFHLLIKYDNIDKKYAKSWYNSVLSLDGVHQQLIKS